MQTTNNVFSNLVLRKPKLKDQLSLYINIKEFQILYKIEIINSHQKEVYKEQIKYYFEDSLPTFDKLNIIRKKRHPFQRQALIKNLIVYIKESLFKSLIQFIIGDIGRWDSDIVLFPQILYLILINTDYIIDNELFNIIFKHMIDSVTVGDEKKEMNILFILIK